MRGAASRWEAISSFAAESARFGYPELRAGLRIDRHGAAVHVMGRKIAFELLTLCENITPQRAYELGLVNRVVPGDQSCRRALAMAEIIAKWNPEFVGQTKRTFHRAASLEYRAGASRWRATSWS